jgi:hypothetical protein
VRRRNKRWPFIDDVRVEAGGDRKRSRDFLKVGARDVLLDPGKAIGGAAAGRVSVLIAG